MSSQPNLFKQAFGFWGVLGVLIGIISITNLIVGGFQLGIAPVIEKIFDAYVWLFHNVLFDFLFGWISISVPTWAKDLFSIYIVIQGIWSRSFISILKNTQHDFNYLSLFTNKGYYNSISSVLIMLSFVFWPLALAVWIFVGFEEGFSMQYDSEIATPIWLQCIVVLLGVALLLATNAGLS